MRLASLTIIFCLAASVAGAQTITPGPQTSGAVLPGAKTPGNYFGPVADAAPVNKPIPAANTLLAVPVFIGSPSALKSLSFDIGTGNTNAWNARMCVYADNGAGKPGALVSGTDTGAIAIASGSVTGVQTATLSNPVTLYGPAWYWLAFFADNASASVYSLANTNSFIMMNTLLGVSTSDALFLNTPVTTGVKVSQAFGACPATFGTAAYNTNNNTPYVVMGF